MSARIPLVTGALLASAALAPAPAGAAEFWLRAAATDSGSTLPGSPGLPMYGYAACEAGFTGCTAPSAPGPVLEIPAGDTTLTVHLQNALGVPTSLIVTGLAPAQPIGARDASSAPLASLAPAEVPADGTADYVFQGVRAGTYVYQSGSDPKVQVPMGLAGAVAAAYPAGTYAAERTIVFSEVDPGQHAAAPPTAALMRTYLPQYFLVNGQPFSPAAAPLLSGATGDRVLLRLVNVGLQERAPQLLGGHFTIVAEDGHARPASLRHPQTTALLGPAKTLDVEFVSPLAGTYTLYDRRLALVNAGASGGGLMTRLAFAGDPPPPPGDVAPTANGDAYAAVEDTTLNVAAPGVLANDSGSPQPSVSLASPPAHGTVSLAAGGSFAYEPAPNYAGADSFTYVASNAAGTSAPATVALTIAAVNDAPVAVTPAPAAFLITDGTAGTTGSRTASWAAPGVLADRFTDAENDPFALSSSLTPAVTFAPAASGSATLTAQGDLSFTYARNWAGVGTFDVAVTDTGTPAATSAPSTVQVVRDLRITSLLRIVNGISVTGAGRPGLAGTALSLRATGTCTTGTTNRSGTVVATATVTNLGFLLAWTNFNPNTTGCTQFLVEATVPAAGGVAAHPLSIPVTRP